MIFPKLIVKAFIDPLAWGIRTEKHHEPICEISQREGAKQWADLFAAAPDLLEAVNRLLAPSSMGYIRRRDEIASPILEALIAAVAKAEGR